MADCPLEGCPGMNEDGTCPNGYGITCESRFPEPTNMDDYLLNPEPKVDE